MNVIGVMGLALCVVFAFGELSAGVDPELQRRCQQVVDEVVASGEQGAVQFCAYRDGECIVDVWAGGMSTNVGAARIDGSTLFPIYSTEKPVFATAVHRAVERGLMAYDKPLSTWWPEFVGDGKENLTLGLTLGYRSGMPPRLDPKVFRTVEEQCDWQKICEWAARVKPELPPGTVQRYMPASYGWYLGHPLEVAYGKPLKETLDELVLRPAGVEDGFFFSAGDAEIPRIVTIYGSSKFEGMNDDRRRRMCLPSAYAVANARSIAKFYNRLCGFDGQPPLVRKETLEAALVACRHESDPLPQDLDTKWQMVFGMGYGLWGERSDLSRVFGHGGFGGSEGLCDRRQRLTVGFTCNFCQNVCPVRSRLYALVGMKWRYGKDADYEVRWPCKDGRERMGRLTVKSSGESTLESVGAAGPYAPTWESLDARPVPQWWRDAKFGIFVHWGPYAVPAYAPTDAKSIYKCYAEWYHGRLIGKDKEFANHHARHYGNAPYGNFAAAFTAENFNPDEWAELFRKAGARYAVLTSKHHDGYALWPSAVTPYYNSVAIGPGRDLCGEFAAAMKRAGLRSGFYYSLLEYANPLYPKRRDGVNDAAALPMKEWAARMNLPQMKELVERYKADIIWPDGEWDWSDEDQRSTEFLAWLYNDSGVRDTVAVNDRWGTGCRGRHGGYYTTEYGNADEGVVMTNAYVHPWEECRGIGNSFGYNRYETPDQYMSREKCIETLVSTVSRGGNLLLNVGPTADGRIPAIMQDRLLAIGRWLSTNGEAIYASRRSSVRAVEERVYTTETRDAVYAIDCRKCRMPFHLKGIGKVRAVELVGDKVMVSHSTGDDVLEITPPVPMRMDSSSESVWCYKVAR